jgi:hypothetical protein
LYEKWLRSKKNTQSEESTYGWADGGAWIRMKWKNRDRAVGISPPPSTIHHPLDRWAIGTPLQLLGPFSVSVTPCSWMTNDRQGIRLEYNYWRLEANNLDIWLVDCLPYSCPTFEEAQSATTIVATKIITIVIVHQRWQQQEQH